MVPYIGIIILGCLLMFYLIINRICECVEMRSVSRNFNISGEAINEEDISDYLNGLFEQMDNIGVENIDITEDIIKVRLKNGYTNAFLTNSEEIKEQFKNYKNNLEEQNEK